MIKDFIPARTSLTSGVVIKSHLLERNRYPQPQIGYEDITHSGSIDAQTDVFGGTGGVLDPFNILINNISFSSSATDYILNGSFINPLVNVEADYSEPYIGYSPTYGYMTVNFYGQLQFQVNGLQGGTGYIYTNIYSSLNGLIDTITGSASTALYNCVPDETFWLVMNSSTSWLPIYNFQFLINSTLPVSYQTWLETTIGPSGSLVILHSTQDEFYNGELPGTVLEVSDGELNPGNTFKYPSTLEVDYVTVFYPSNTTLLSTFLDNATSPNTGEMYLWYDTGSLITPYGSQNYAGPEYAGG
jgi:hypothetical protein